MDIGIDLGTSSIKIYVKNKGIILNEPSIVSVDTRSGKIIDFGIKAKEIMGKTPGYIKVISPIVEGVISDFELAEQMISHYAKLAIGRRIFKPRVAISVSTGITDVEVKAVLEATESTGIRKILLIEKPVAAAIGAEFELSNPYGKMIVNVGGGISDAAILSLNGVVASASVKVAGKHMDDALIRYVKDKHNVILGHQTAEELKYTAGNVYESNSHKKYPAKGRNIITGLPEIVEISELETFVAYHESIYEIAKMIQSVIERTPPELVSDLANHGIHLAGGGALLRGFSAYLENYLQVQIVMVDDPINCVAIGTGHAFDFRAVLTDGFINAS